MMPTSSNSKTQQLEASVAINVHTHTHNYQIDKDLHMADQPVRGERFIYNQSQNENEAGQFVDLEYQGSHCQC